MSFQLNCNWTYQETWRTLLKQAGFCSCLAVWLPGIMFVCVGRETSKFNQLMSLLEHQETGMMTRTPPFCYHTQRNYLKPRMRLTPYSSGSLHRWASGLQMINKPEFTLLLPPGNSKQEKEDVLEVSPPAHSWVCLLHHFHLCNPLSIWPVHVLVLGPLSLPSATGKESSSIVGLVFFFLICQP